MLGAFLLGLTMMIRSVREEKILERLQKGIEKLDPNKEASIAEQGVYMIYQWMDSENPAIQRKFQALILNSEESINS